MELVLPGGAVVPVGSVVVRHTAFLFSNGRVHVLSVMAERECPMHPPHAPHGMNVQMESDELIKSQSLHYRCQKEGSAAQICM